MAFAFPPEVKGCFKRVKAEKPYIFTGVKAHGDAFNLALVGLTISQLQAKDRAQVNREKKIERKERKKAERKEKGPHHDHARSHDGDEARSRLTGTLQAVDSDMGSGLSYPWNSLALRTLRSELC
jgi:hypothetical protein